MSAFRSLVLIACLIMANSASAQCRLCTVPSTSSSAEPTSDDIQLQIETSLSFDRLILAGAGTGAATVRPDGSSGTEGSVVELGPRATVGTVLVHGQANRTVRVELPRRIELFSVAGGRMTLDDVGTDLPVVARLDAAGNMRFRFGGRLILSGDCDGPFRGDLPISVEYQ